jgi:hypothetical protein
LDSSLHFRFEELLEGIPASWLSGFHAVAADFCDAPPLQEKT